MKSSARIISLVLVIVTLFSAFSFNALADGEGHTYTGQSFWGWLLGEGTPDWLDSVVGFVSSDYCEDSPTHLHTANSYLRKTNFIEKVGSLGTFDYECQCQYCGDTFFVNEKNVAEVFHDSYADYVNNTVKSNLNTTLIGSNGFYIPLPVSLCYETNYGDDCYVEPSTFGEYFSVTIATGIYRSLFVLTFDSSSLSSITIPVTGFASVVADLSLYNCAISVDHPFVSHLPVVAGQPLSKYTALFPYSFYFSRPCPTLFIKTDNSTFSHVSGTFYLFLEPYSYSYDDFTFSVGGSSSRAASITGDIGIMGDNGQLTKVDGDQIFNETTNNYYNPNTGLSIPVTDWAYDYSTRSYNLTLDTGDKVTVTYGDENITVQESNTTYNVYYITTNYDESDKAPDGHYHQWGTPTDTTPATCTNPGSETYTCSVCGVSKTVQLPALGHKWKVLRTVQTKYDDAGQLVQEGYTLYECERCGEQYKQDATSTGPPGGSQSGGTGSGGSDDDGESIWDKLGKLFGTLGGGILDAIGSIISKLLDALISLAEMIAEKLVAVVEIVLKIFDALPQLFSGFLKFLESAFSFLPDDIILLLTFGIVAVVAIGIIKAVRR